MQSLDRTLESAKRFTDRGALSDSAQENTEIEKQLETYLACGEARIPIKQIEVRIDDEREEVLILKNRRQGKVKLQSPRTIEFWKPLDLDFPEVLLATLALPPQPSKTLTASISLWDGQLLAAGVQRTWTGKSVLYVCCDQPEVAKTRFMRLHRWQQITAIAAPALAVLAVCIAIGFILLVTRTQHVPNDDVAIKGGEKPQISSSNENRTAADSQANSNIGKRTGMQTQNSSTQVAVAPSDKVPKLRAGTVAKGVETLRSVRNMSIDIGTDEFEAWLRDRLKLKIEELTHIHIIEDAGTAEARMRIKIGPNYVFKVISQGLKLFEWPTAISNRTEKEAHAIADHVAAAMKTRIEQEEKVIRR
ncbi:MAG: hypothetical protein AABO57_07750 [Acidobacteriota bacterium]